MSNELLVLGLAFLVAGILARTGNRLGLPTIPLFIAAGILFGPNTPGPVLIEHPEDLALLASFGLIFLLFYLGVELSVEDLTSGGRRLVASAAVYLGLNVGAGLAFGFALGWGTREALIVAGITGISSSAIVTKVVVELRRLANPETPLILGIIVIEDLFLALYLAALAPILGDASSAGEAVLLFLRALAFLVVLALAARWGGPVVQRLLGARDDELLVVLFVGLALAVAGAAEALGVSEAIGAFTGSPPGSPKPVGAGISHSGSPSLASSATMLSIYTSSTPSSSSCAGERDVRKVSKPCPPSMCSPGTASHTFATTKMSSPRPPFIVSRPGPPRRRSTPLSPISTSSSSPPRTTSSPCPPLQMSLPGPQSTRSGALLPVTVSFPSWATMHCERLPPERTSDAGDPSTTLKPAGQHSTPTHSSVRSPPAGADALDVAPDSPDWQPATASSTATNACARRRLITSTS